MSGAIISALLLFSLGCTSLKVYKRTPIFIDIEANQDDVWIGCSDVDLKAVNSLMTFYLLADETTHEFMFRRVISVSRCLELQKEYRSLSAGVAKVRFVGIQPTVGDGVLITKRAPDKFKKSRAKTTWTFIRFQTKDGCESYFKGDCRPERYWGGVVPQE